MGVSRKRRGGESLQSPGSLCLQPNAWATLTSDPKARSSTMSRNHLLHLRLHGTVPIRAFSVFHS